MLDVLRAMRYGGSGPNGSERLGQSGDEGVDGVIREDKLGLDQIYVRFVAAVQAKRDAGDLRVVEYELRMLSDEAALLG